MPITWLILLPITRMSKRIFFAACLSSRSPYLGKAKQEQILVSIPIGRSGQGYPIFDGSILLKFFLNVEATEKRRDKQI
jgi:hypothetical protein